MFVSFDMNIVDVVLDPVFEETAVTTTSLIADARCVCLPMSMVRFGDKQFENYKL